MTVQHLWLTLGISMSDNDLQSKHARQTATVTMLY